MQMVKRLIRVLITYCTNRHNTSGNKPLDGLSSIYGNIAAPTPMRLTQEVIAILPFVRCYPTL